MAEVSKSGTVPTYLVVDDHEGFREEIRRWLERECPGKVVECNNGRQAIEIHTRLQPDLVFMDVEMPEVDGISATRSICSRFPSAVVIILTQHDSPELRKAAEQCGARGFVPKENLGELIQVIHSLKRSD